MHLDDARVIWVTEGLDKPLVLTLGSSLFERDPDDRTNITIDGSVNDVPIDVETEIDSVSSLVAGRSLDMEASIDIGQYSLDADARLGFSEIVADSEVSLSVTGPDVVPLLTRLGVEGLTTGDVRLSGNLVRAGPGLAWRSVVELANMGWRPADRRRNRGSPVVLTWNSTSPVRMYRGSACCCACRHCRMVTWPFPGASTRKGGD